MKTISFKNRPYVNVPNAATRREVLHQLVDRLMVVACCTGLITAIVFLLSLA